MEFAEGESARIETAHGNAGIVRSARQLDPNVWRSAFSGGCLDWRYYELVEEALSGQFDFRYAVLTRERTGETAIQPFFFAEVDITSGLPRRFRSLVTHVIPGGKRLAKMRLLAVGCAAGDGRLGSNEPWALEMLDQALAVYARREEAGLIVFKDFPARYRERLGALPAYRRIASMPTTQLDLTSFSTFDEYLQAKMSAGIRSNLRRKFRDSARLATLTLEVVEDASACVGEITDLYLQTYRRSAFRFERLTEDYFRGLPARMPGRTRYFLWRRDGRLVAFAVCIVDGGVLRYLNLGMDYDDALDLHLYFWVWRGLVSWALEHGMKTLHAGQLNYEAKFRLGLDLVPLDLYVRPLSPLLKGALTVTLPFLGPTRYDPALRRFGNFGTL